MSEIAVLNRSGLDDAAVAYAAAACDLQLRRDFLSLWPGVAYTPVRFYASATDLPVASDLARLMIVSDTIDLPNVLGYHEFGPLVRGVVLAQGDQTSVTLSHECLEMAADPLLSNWARRNDGKYVAVEIADPVEADSYAIDVTILGETRSIRVSNFVTPAWFEPSLPGPYDFGGSLSAAFELAPGGYCVVRDSNGSVTDEWGRAGHPTALARRFRKRWNGTSRTYRRGVR